MRKDYFKHRDWYNFNVAQRVHQNYLENINWMSLSVLAAGLYKPQVAAAMGAVMIIARGLYLIGATKGKKCNGARIAGVILTTLSCLTCSGIFIYNVVKNCKCK